MSKCCYTCYYWDRNAKSDFVMDRKPCKRLQHLGITIACLRGPEEGPFCDLYETETEFENRCTIEFLKLCRTGPIVPLTEEKLNEMLDLVEGVNLE